MESSLERSGRIAAGLSAWKVADITAEAFRDEEMTDLAYEVPFEGDDDLCIVLELKSGWAVSMEAYDRETGDDVRLPFTVADLNQELDEIHERALPW